MGDPKGRGRRGRLGLAVAVVALFVAGVVAADRRPLREAEAAYLAGRDVTACATRELRPFAEEQRELDELPEALDQLIADARADAEAVRSRSRDLGGGLLPATRGAVRAVHDALDAEVSLYAAMDEDPGGSEDELAALGRANAAAERRLRAARSWLAAGEPDDWDRRFSCRDAGAGG